jgi:hypothetical protein
MRTDGQKFIDLLAVFPPSTFESTFSSTCNRLELGESLSPEDLTLLFEAAICAALCNIALNGRGGCGGRISPQAERNRIRLERKFMSACKAFWTCDGGRNLSRAKKSEIQHFILRVEVQEENLVV